MSVRGKRCTQKDTSSLDEISELRDQNVEGDSILFDIKNGCDHKRLSEKITLNLSEELDNLHVSASISSKTCALIVEAPEEITDAKPVYRCSDSDTMGSNQKLENNQKHQININNQETTPSTPKISSANNTVEAKDKNPTDQIPAPKGMNEGTYTARKWQQPPFLKSQSLDLSKESTFIHNMPQQAIFHLPEINETHVAGNFEKARKICQRKNSIFDYSMDSVYGENGAITDETDPLSSDSLDNPSYDSFDAGSGDKSMEFVSCSRALQRPSIASKLNSLESRPIYPNVPYSPYASPYGSPRTNRRRPPLRESRRISIEKSGSFLQLNQYKLMDQIGQGSYGLVKLAYSEEDSTHYAMKILSKRRLLRQAGLMRRGPKKATSPLDRVYREIAVLKKLDHPNIVKMVEVLDDPMEDSLYMVFELVKQGEVLSIPTDKPLSEERSWSVFRDTLLGLEYLHYQRIIHADLKPGNLLLTECGHVKIADLGVCNEFLGEDATMSNGSTAGTPAFRAPETLNLGQHTYCGRAADIWALGTTLYSLVFGNVPFVANSIPVLYEKIKEEMFSFPHTQHISDTLRNCIQSMLTKDPVKRITLPHLKEHIWVTASGMYPLPSEDENCRLVQVSDDDINSVVRSIPKLDTLILIKTMLKKHSFGNPFVKGGVSGRAPQRGGSRLERFIRAGRSNSAPGSYHLAIDRQLSGDNMLPSLAELGTSSNNEES